MADAVLSLSGFAQQGGDFVLTDVHAHAFKKFDDVGVFEVEGDFQFTKNQIIVQTFFGFGLLALAFAALFVDKAVEKCRQFFVVQFFIFFVTFGFEPIADLGAGSLIAAGREKFHHFVVAVVESVAELSEYFVVLQGKKV